MKWYRIAIVLMLSLFLQYAKAQNVGLVATKANQLDTKGLKQGYWVKKFPDDKLQYTATFKNNKHVGTYTRYYENGSRKSVIEYNTKSYGPARFYDEDNKLVCKGFYSDQLRDSVWQYLNPDSTVGIEERYAKGILQGKCVKYFWNGKIAQIIYFSKGKQNGLWRSYYETGQVREECNMVDGLRSGAMNSFYTTGKMKSTGHYVRNYKDGDWKFFDERGKLIRTVIYKMGKTDDKEWEERDNTELLNLEKNRSKLKDPEKYRNDPSGYMRNGGGAFDGGE